MKIPFKTAFEKHARVQFKTTGPSMTHQANAAECDINRIMQKYEKTGVLEHRNKFEGQYGDFTELPQDYHASMNAVLAAGDMFMTLPAQIRRRFGNDAGAFLDFVGNPDNKSEMEKLGLTKPAPKKPPERVEPPALKPKPYQEAEDAKRRAPAPTPPANGEKQPPLIDE